MISGEENFSRVALIGFDGSTLRTLEYFFQSRPAGKRFQLVPTYKDADWVVFHADQPTDKDTLKNKLQNEIQLPAIVVSVKPLNWPHTVSVVKPYASHDLEAAIKKLLKAETQKTSQRFDLPPAIDTKSHVSEKVETTTIQEPPVTESPVSAQEEPLVVEEVAQVKCNEGHALQPSVITAKVVFPKVTSLKEAAEKRIAIEKQQTQTRRGVVSSEATVASVRAQVVARVSESAARANNASFDAAEIDSKKKSTLAKETPEGSQETPRLNDKPAIELKKRPASPVKKRVETVKDDRPTELDGAMAVDTGAQPKRKAKSTIDSSTHKVKLVSPPAKRIKKAINNSVAGATSIDESVIKPVSKKVEKIKLPETAEGVSSDKEPAATVLQQAVEKAQAKLRAEKTKKPSLPNHFLNMGTVFGHLPELNWDDPADRRRLSLNLDGMLLPWVEKAVIEGRKNNSSVAIDGLHLRLEYLPWTDCFVTNLSEEVLYTVMTSRFSIGELSIRAGDVLEDDLQEGIGFTERVINATDLLWLAGMWTAQGRVLPGDNPLESRLLMSVPEYIKQIKVPEVHSIVELWTEKKMTALEIKEALSIPQRYVFGVMAAAFTANLFSTNDSSLLANERAR